MTLPQVVRRSLFFQSLILTSLLGVSVPSTFASRSQLDCNSRSLSSARLQLAGSQTLVVTMTNTRSSSITVSKVNVANAVFTVSDFTVQHGPRAAGQSVHFSVSYSPTMPGVGPKRRGS
jgi:hypothetical protein